MKTSNITRVIYNLIATAAVMIMFSSVCYAEVSFVKVDLECGKSSLRAPWREYPGDPSIQYNLETVGIKESDIKDVIKVIEQIPGETKMGGGSGMDVYVNAVCIPSGNDADISLTGSKHPCEKGEGLKVKMFRPNDISPDKFHYIGKLTIIRDEDERERLQKEYDELQQRIAENNRAIAKEKERIFNSVSEIERALQSDLDRTGIWISGGSH